MVLPGVRAVTARAMWKGVICFGRVRVPVKLYAAVADRSVHFRLLHKKDRVPVRQAMVTTDNDDIVPWSETRRAFVTEDRDWVVLDDEDLEAAAPPESRDIEIIRFLPPRVIDHRWYLRPYYLGPDGADKAWAAFAAALSRSGREGLAHWTMRKKEYIGALRMHAGYPVLVSLRHAGEVVAAEELKAPGGRALDTRELDMAKQLIGMLEAPFDPAEFPNEHRARILELIETKRRGGRAKVIPFKRPEPTADLSKALEASLKRERKSA
jgi:DNA end-binding protein Ku